MPERTLCPTAVRQTEEAEKQVSLRYSRAKEYPAVAKEALARAREQGRNRNSNKK